MSPTKKKYCTHNFNDAQTFHNSGNNMPVCITGHMPFPNRKSFDEFDRRIKTSCKVLNGTIYNSTDMYFNITTA